MYWDGWIELSVAILLSTAIEVGVIFGPNYPCIGQISKGIEEIYYFTYYTITYVDYGDDVLLTTMGIYMFEMYNTLSVNMCANGFLWNPTKSGAFTSDPFLTSSTHTVNTVLELVILGVDVYELLDLIWYGGSPFAVGMFLGKLVVSGSFLIIDVIMSLANGTW